MKVGNLVVIMLAIFGVVFFAIFIENENNKSQQLQINDHVLTVLEKVDNQDVSLEIQYIRDCADEAGVSMAQLNLSEDAVQKILRQGYVSEARSWIKIAHERKCSENVEPAIEYAKKYAGMAGMSLADFGLADDVLREILRQGFISEARKWLAIADRRKNEEDVTYAVDFAKKYASKAGVKIDEI